MKTTSVRAGEYEPTPMHGPITAESCGTAPEAWLFAWKMRPIARVTSSPSWMRAPAESQSPTTGSPSVRARSIAYAIFSPWAAPTVPAMTLQSCA